MYRLFYGSKLSRILSATVLALLACRGASAQQAADEFEDWNLEPGVGQAHLVMVARVASIGQVTLVQGAKTDVALREYRFQPVRRLKGIFQREQLSMTGADLGLSNEDASVAPPLTEGEFRLLILVQQSGLNTYGCVAAAPGATTFDQRVPRVTGPGDPLVGVVETLIKVADARSRRQRAKLLVDRLADTDGVSAVPLLTSLRLRSDWAAADERSLSALARLARNSANSVRGAAIELLCKVLANPTVPKNARQLDIVADALRETLDSAEIRTSVRLSALEALGHLLLLTNDATWARERLIAQLTGANTYAERAATATALARAPNSRAAAAVAEALAALPLDEPPVREFVFARDAVTLDRAGAERVLLTRLERSIKSGQSLQSEVETLGQMRSSDSLPLLLAAAAQVNLATADRQCIARALGRLGDDRAVPVLIGWLRTDYQLKDFALSALENLDTELAAREVRALLRTEPHLPYKLRMARLLARHRLADGYSLATEHLADAGNMAAATLVLAALDDPRTKQDLSAIMATHPDRRWHAAALSGLAAIGDASARKQLLEILADDRNPLVIDAAEAAGLAGDAELLMPLAALLRSRNKQIAVTSLVAVRRFLSGVRTSPRGLEALDATAEDTSTPDLDPAKAAPTVNDLPAKTRNAIAEAAASLVTDAYVESDVRQEAFAVARQLGGDRYPQLLAEVADQAELEGTPLLAAVQAEMRKQIAAK